jgi:hypothetical protein
MRRIRLISKMPEKAADAVPEVKLTVLVQWLEATRVLFAAKENTDVGTG